ncbi:MAG TPA: hypothetical protein VGK56_05040, partial [Anaerolineales bacterium]
MRNNTWLAGTVFLVLLSLLALRLLTPMPGLDARGSAIGIRIAFLLILYAYINLAGLGLGRFLLKPFDLPLLTGTEFALLAYLLGLGCLSAGVMILGLVNWLNSLSIFLLLVSVGVIAWIEWAGTKGWFSVKRFPKPRG